MSSAKKRRRARHLVTALLSAVSLFAAPVAASVRAACDLCPKDCPMHSARDDGGNGAHKLGCHGAANHAEAPGGMRVSRPPCRDHAGIAGLSLQQPMLRNAYPLLPLPGPELRRRTRPLAAPLGAAPPPDSPPPRRV